MGIFVYQKIALILLVYCYQLFGFLMREENFLMLIILFIHFEDTDYDNVMNHKQLCILYELYHCLVLFI